MSESNPLVEGLIIKRLDGLELFIRAEIAELKSDVLKMIDRVERELKDDLHRIAADVRAHDLRIRSLETSHNRRTGSSATLAAFGHFVSAIVGGIIAGVATFLARPHP